MIPPYSRNDDCTDIITYLIYNFSLAKKKKSRNRCEVVILEEEEEGEVVVEET